MREVGGVVLGCGTGRVDPGEACDDGNTRGGDGCSADCKTIETDFDCPRAGHGRACTWSSAVTACWAATSGAIRPTLGAGCSATADSSRAMLRSAARASPNPAQPARCHATVCGDGNKEGAEACDDSNVVDGDGCAASCTFEPDCSTGACVSKCGDGIKLAPEACDDGNTSDGDGCSQSCAPERASRAPTRR